MYLWGTWEGRMKKEEVGDKKTEPRPREREWQRTGSCYLSSSVWPQLTGALSGRESWTISLQWRGIWTKHHSVLTPRGQIAHSNGRLISDCLQKWAGPWVDIRFPLIGNIFSCISFRKAGSGNTGLHFPRWPGHRSGLLTPDLERAPGELAQLCRVLHEWSRIDMQCTLYFLSSPSWFALTLFKMEEEISLRGVSCPQVHDHSDLMCTISAVSREGHKDQSLKVGLSAI